MFPKVRPRNWQRFQHYKNRNPPWIKLHCDLLTSKDWVTLDDASRVLAIASMLLASKSELKDGSFDADPEYVKRVAYLHVMPNFKPLIDCGFLEVLADASNEQATACCSALLCSESSSVISGEGGVGETDGPPDAEPPFSEVATDTPLKAVVAAICGARRDMRLVPITIENKLRPYFPISESTAKAINAVIVEWMNMTTAPDRPVAMLDAYLRNAEKFHGEGEKVLTKEEEDKLYRRNMGAK